MRDKEEWRPVKGFEGFYMISSFGRVKSLDRKVKNGIHGTILVKGRFPKTYLDKQGYERVRLSKEGIQKIMLVHRLVALSFIENHKGKKTVNHINGIKNDNHISNLEWATQSENNKHSFRIGLSKPRKGIEHHKSILTNEDIISIRANKELSSIKMAKIYGVCSSTIRQIRRNEIWTHL